MSHSISAEEYARVIAKVYEPSLDWDNPAEYDLLDREQLTASAKKMLDALAWSGYAIQRLDDLALDEFSSDMSARDRENRAIGWDEGHEVGYQDRCQWTQTRNPYRGDNLNREGVV